MTAPHSTGGGPTTRIVTRADGTASLQLRPARLVVVRGPDRGRELKMERQRARIGTGADCQLRLTDPSVSRDHVELLATEAGYQIRDLGSTNGTTVAGVRLGRAVIVEATRLTLGDTTVAVEPLQEVVERPLSRRGQFGQLLGRSPAMRQVFAQLEAVAATDSTVLLEGESGCGKELAAEGIHRASARRDAPFVVFDCGAVPAPLIESELFGHVRGAFSGADRDRTGVIEQARAGTLLLDEVGELPLVLQPRLLRFLEGKQLKPVGGAEQRTVDVRVVAATNRILAHDVEAGTFRQDLFYRLAVVRIELPPLRERPEDVVLLAHHFAQQHVRDPAELVSAEIEALLESHHWPGNARELRNAIERIAVAPELGKRSLAEAVRATPPPALGQLAELPFHDARRRWQDRFEREYLGIQLERANGVVARAAELAGIPRQTVHRLLRRHGLRSAK